MPVSDLNPRRLTSVAVATGLLAVVLIVVALSGGGDEESGDGGSGWVIGLLLMLAPLLSAGVARSTVGTSRFRPVGWLCALVATVTALLHVAVAVDERGVFGWALGAPAMATAAVLVVAVVGAGRRRAAPERVEPEPGRAPDPSAAPPVDVLPHLRTARDHAAKAVAAWLVVLALSGVAVPAFHLLGWPKVSARIEATVVDIRPADEERTAVTFQARHDERTVRWTYTVENPVWELGQRNQAYVDDDGRVHEDQQFGLAGIPLLMPVLFAVFFLAFAARRLWGLFVALVDARNAADQPRLGYAAVIHDPAPKTWRPLLAVWSRDPTVGDALARPDAVYRADDETSEDLETSATAVVVRPAWIDTGNWPLSKPRWVAFGDGVAVPHRRSLFGRWYVGAITRRGTARLAAKPERSGHEHRHHDLMGMVRWRLLVLPIGIALAFLRVDHGTALQVLG